MLNTSITIKSKYNKMQKNKADEILSIIMSANESVSQ